MGDDDQVDIEEEMTFADLIKGMAPFGWIAMLAMLLYWLLGPEGK